MVNTVPHRPRVPAGWHAVTPRIVVTDVRRFIEFLIHVFGATGKCEPTRPSVVWIGDSPVMVSDVGFVHPRRRFCTST